jgi:beta-glucosidase
MRDPRAKLEPNSEGDAMTPATESDSRLGSRPTLKAFDAEEIHAGNFALGIDHEKVARETDAVMARMSLEQKIHEIRGRGPRPIDSLWYAGGDASLGIAPWKMVDGPRGARAGVATAFPVAIARAASFDVELERRVGMAIGLEVAAKGGNVLLAPTLNLLRHPGWGRAQETYSEDPHHTGAMGAAFVSGAQNFVLTSPKHFALNNLENTRFQLSSEIDARTLHEVYLPHFKRCVVEAGAASVMSAYNKMNGIYCGEHPELLDAILRGDWGFTGFVESDWFLGTRSTAPAIRAGMDIEMPAGFRFSDENLEEALASGELSEEDIHRNARRSLYQKVAWQLTGDGVAGKARPEASVVECDEHVALAREAAEKSIVLLRNVGEVLPLAREECVSIAVVGDLADQINLGDRGSSMVASSSVTKPLAGIRAAAGSASVEYFPSDADLSRLAEFDVAVIVAGLTYRDEGEFIPTAQQEAEGGDLARGGDRDSLELPPEQRDLIERAAAAAKRSVVVLQGGSAIIVRDWIDRVDALLMAWYGGREGGHALARVLFGDVSPSGRLPVSFPRGMDQLMPWDTAALSVQHGLLHGYRWLDHHGHEPEFPFGFGLGYTTCELASLRLERVRGGFVCRVDVRNTGARSGATLVQLYVSCRDSRVARVEKELKGFGRVELEPGAEATLEIEVRDEDLRYYDADAHAWVFEDCRYVFRVGQSSADLPLEVEWVGPGATQRG